MQVGNLSLTATATSNPQVLTTNTFNPGQFSAATYITTTVPRGGAPLAPLTDILDVIPLPTWMSIIPGLYDKFDPTSRTYQFSATLVNLNTSAFSGFQLPIVPGLWLATEYQSGVNANMVLGVEAKLNPAAALPIENLQAGGTLNLLGTQITLVPQSTIPLNLDPRSLGLLNLTYKFTSTSSANMAVPFLKNSTFGILPLKINPSLTASVYYNVSLTVSLNPNGTLNPFQSLLSLNTTTSFQGTLAIPSFTLGNAQLDAGISTLKSVVTAANPVVGVVSSLVSYLTDALQDAGVLPSFNGSASADGSFQFDAVVGLQGNPFAATTTGGSITGQFFLNAPTVALNFSFLGKNYTAASVNLGTFLDLPHVNFSKSF